jgi:hypothetical protein
MLRPLLDITYDIATVIQVRLASLSELRKYIGYSSTLRTSILSQGLRAGPRHHNMVPPMYLGTCNSCFRHLVDDNLVWDASRFLSYNKVYAHRKSQIIGANSQLRVNNFILAVR